MRSQKTLKKNLDIGQTYQYSELCKIINEPVMKGGSKKSQRVRWQKYFDFELSPDGYKILYIPSRVREPDPLDSSGKFRKHINVLLVDYLQKHDGVCNMTLAQLMELFGFVNPEFLESDNGDIETFKTKDLIYTVGRTNIPKAFDYLSEQEIIYYDKQTYFVMEDGTHVKATAIDKMKLDDLKESVMSEMHCKTEKDIFASHRQFGFFKKLTPYLKEYLGISKFYYKYHIEYIGKKRKWLTPEEISTKRIQVNQEMIKSLENKFVENSLLETLVENYVKL
ncbi:MAG: hypothetical protein SPK26_11075 [Treponema sp.]|nr:hypothetical protein [Treponema sp.]